MGLNIAQSEFLDALNEAYANGDYTKEPSDWAEGFLKDNLDRYDEEGMQCFFSGAQWKWLHIIAEENYGINKEDYEEA